MTKEEQIRKIFDALHMQEEVWDENSQQYIRLRTIQGDKRIELSNKLADLLIIVDPSSEEV
jgi:hypothetical protein